MIKDEFGLFMKALDDFQNKYIDNRSIGYVVDSLKKDARVNRKNVILMVRNKTDLNMIIPCEANELIYKLLSTGNFHLYRGYLNPLKAGPDLEKLYLGIIDDLLEKKIITEQHKKDAIGNLRDAINSAG